MVKICLMNFFDNNGFFGSVTARCLARTPENLMKTDIRETDDAKAYRFAVELPGFEEGRDPCLDMQRRLSDHQPPRRVWTRMKQDKKGRVLRQERYCRCLLAQLLRRQREARGREGEVRSPAC